MNDQQLELDGIRAFELGCAVAVKQAAIDNYHSGRPDLAQYLNDRLRPEHHLLLGCMKEAGAFTQVAHTDANGRPLRK
jgi:hypothetical protein